MPAEQPSSAAATSEATAVAQFCESLSESDLASLTALTPADLSDRLKALGFSKLGQRLKIEKFIQSATLSVPTDRPDAVRRIANVDDWEATLAQAASDNHTLIAHFSAVWCQPCKEIAPYVEALASEFPKVVFVKVDVEEAGEVAQAVGIRLLPSFVAYHDGKPCEVDQVVGPERAALRTLVKNVSGFSGAVAFTAASTFKGARPGCVFKLGDKGLGYYRDKGAAERPDALKRVMGGNLSWLSEESEPAAEPEPESAPMSTALVVKRDPEAEAAEAEEARQRSREEAIKPYEPPLVCGKFTEIGHYVQVVSGRSSGEWGVCTNIKMNHFDVKLDNGDHADGIMYTDLKTTELKPKAVEALRAKHNTRRARVKALKNPKRVVSDEMKRRMEQLKLEGPLRLTDTSARDVAEPGKGKGYYYAAITSNQHVLPLPEPKRIGSADLRPEATAPAAADAADTPATSGYYYAHQTQKVDYRVPLPAHKRLDIADPEERERLRKLKELKRSAEYQSLLDFNRSFREANGRDATRNELRAARPGLMPTYLAFKELARQPNSVTCGAGEKQ